MIAVVENWIEYARSKLLTKCRINYMSLNLNLVMARSARSGKLSERRTKHDSGSVELKQ